MKDTEIKIIKRLSYGDFIIERNTGEQFRAQLRFDIEKIYQAHIKKGKNKMKVTTNEERNELSGPPTSNLKLALPCRFCGSLPDWEELDTGHRWRKSKYSKWDGWLTHECKSKYYALAGSRRYVYEDWNIQQKSRHAANNPNQ